MVRVRVRPTLTLTLTPTPTKVSLFGLSSDPCRPFHYYGPAKPSCTPEIPKENDERVHWFEKEHELYDVWSRQGKLTQFS